METTAIVWLRRDLRLNDHFAFHKAQDIGAKILPIFIFDSEILKNFSDPYDKRISFIFDRLIFLDNELKQHNTQIKVFYGKPVEIIEGLLSALKPGYLIAGAGYEPYDIQRDLNVQECCKRYGVTSIISNDHLIYPPDAVTKDDGDPFKVFTPYSRKLYKKLIADVIQNYEVKQITQWQVALPSLLKSLQIDLAEEVLSLAKMGYNKVLYSPWKSDFQKKDMGSFLSKIDQYKDKRDFLGLEGTSQFSPYLRFGFISIRDCLRLALSSQNSFAWINELMWRDFYAMALYFYPSIQNEEFIAKYRVLQWKKDSQILEKVSLGMTGFPIIDAAMRQLNSIGWVHNRARMIVANFLTKCLLIDWREGEKLYSQKLMDYEMASNVGGWQWSASTGFDAQPYFRMFNPELQSKKFDQYGKYVKEYLPELSHVPSEYIFNPLLYDANLKYPGHIVDYKIARSRSLAFYKKANS